MLAELETGLVALIKQSPLGARLRQVDSLPDLDGESLVKRFATDAPAIYVALGSFPVKDRAIRPKFGIACVARNSRSNQAARHGDGVLIGLHEMLDAAMALASGADVVYGEDDAETAAFEVTACDLITSEQLFKAGVYVGVVQIQSVGDIELPGVLSNLADFKTFAADYDIPPHASVNEHTKWLLEPPDQSSSAPELSDQLNLQE